MVTIMMIQGGTSDDGLILRKHFEPAGEWLEVVQAEPVAVFSAEVLRGIRAGKAGTDASIDRIDVGAILRIRARDRTLVYKIVEHDDEHDVFTGVWPD